MNKINYELKFLELLGLEALEYTRSKEWRVSDKEGKIAGYISDRGVIKTHLKTNCVDWDNERSSESNKYQFSVKRGDANSLRRLGKSEYDEYLVTMDLGKYPSIEIAGLADKILSFKILQDGFSITRTLASDKKAIRYKVYRNELGTPESKYYVIRGSEPIEFEVSYVQRDLESIHPVTNHTYHKSTRGTVTEKKPMAMREAINSNSTGKNIFRKVREEMNSILPFNKDIMAILLEGKEIPKELCSLIPDIKEKAKVKTK